jgi:hypothetical protein
MQTEQNLQGQKSKGEKTETIKELVDRHMADEHHTTTDEELRNARIVLDEPTDVQDESLFEIDNTTLVPPLPGEETEPQTNDKDEDRPPPNPYDVLK